ncbi:MAG: hypothetical protein ACRDZ8_17305 [Acidimicrobiales bacterium]
MPDKTPEHVLGEDWVYRARAGDHPVQVRVLKHGTGRPPRVRVRFLDESFEGREEWVPPGRLKVPWSRVEAWQLSQDRWAAVRRPTPQGEYPTVVTAAEHVMACLPEDVGGCADGGVVTVYDPARLEAEFGIERADLEDPLAFEEPPGVLVCPWPVMERIAIRLAPVFAERLLREVAESVEKDRLASIYGDDHPGSRNWYTPPDQAAAWARRMEPLYDQIRRWCGHEQITRYDELVALRAEVLRVGQVAERAISALEAAGQVKLAKDLANQLGVRVELLRATPRQSDLMGHMLDSGP